jgi:predicted RNase H-like HicB family nuclease
VVRSYTTKYTRIAAGYMGQIAEWPEVVTEGKTIEECREMLRDALQEMTQAYRQEGKEVPPGGDIVEQVLVEA